MFARAKRLKETTTTQERNNRNKDGRTLKSKSSARKQIRKHSSERKQRIEAKRNKRCKKLLGVDLSWLTEDMDPFPGADVRRAV